MDIPLELSVSFEPYLSPLPPLSLPKSVFDINVNQNAIIEKISLHKYVKFVWMNDFVFVFVGEQNQKFVKKK